MSLASIPNRSRVRVSSIRSAGPSSLRLMEMGLVQGVEVEVIRRAPLGDPMQVQIGDYQLSLRHAEADLVDVVAVA